MSSRSSAAKPPIGPRLPSAEPNPSRRRFGRAFAAVGSAIGYRPRIVALELLAQEVWTAPMPLSMLGLQLGTRMTVVRLANGSLFLPSPIPLDGTLKDEIDALGPVRHIVAPNRFHHLFVGEVARAYPDARTYGARGLDKKRRDLRFDAILGSEGESAWASDLRSFELGGVALAESVFLHEPSRTLITADFMQNLGSPDHWLTRQYSKVAGIHRRPGVSRLVRAMFRDRTKARKAVDRILDWDPKRVVLSHGEPIVQDGQAVIRDAYAGLKG